MATTASSSVSAADHLAINSMPLSVNSSSCSSSSAKTSLFDRVANFRRSLIKSQQKKNKVRPTSGTFNFFKSNFSSSSLANVDIAASTNDNTKNGVTPLPGHFEPVENAVTSSNSQHHHTQHLGGTFTGTASASNLSNTIAVDEEDAIYGFTSLRLNNQTSLRRQLNKSQQQQQKLGQPIQRQQSTNGNSKRTSTSSSSPSALFTSSSCISLYETIDEVEPISGGPMSSHSSGDSTSTASFKAPPPPLPPMNTNGKGHFQPNYCKMRSTANSASTRQLRISSMHDSDWKRNRRSSAIIFGSDFHDLIIDDKDDGEPTSMGVTPTSNKQQQNSHYLQHPHSHQNGHQQVQLGQQEVNGKSGNVGKSVVYSAGYSHLHHHPHQLNHSSDDLLLMSHRSQAQYSFVNQYLAEPVSSFSAADSSAPSESVRPYITGRIYENLLNSNSFKSVGQSQHNHLSHHKRSENRKLTKDSGYESASTLVSLTQLNGCVSGVSGLQSSPLPPPASSSTSPPVFQHQHQQNGTLISSAMGNSLHCRSDSLDSANSLCGDVLQSPSPPVPKCQQSNSPPLPPPPPPIQMESVDDLRPPTPPIRYSSLPQYKSFLHRNHQNNGGQLPVPLSLQIANTTTSRLSFHQLNRSLDSTTDSQPIVDQLTMKELQAIALASKSSANLPLPPAAAELLVDSAAHHHHAKQDSWPMVSNGFNVCYNLASSSASLSAAGGPHRQQNIKSTPMAIKTGNSASIGVAKSTVMTSSSQAYPGQYQREHSYSAKPYTVYNGSLSTVKTQSPSLNSLTNMINSGNSNCPSSTSASVRHSIASCSTTAHHSLNGDYNCQGAPSAQIARSQRVQQVARQELCVPAPKQRLSLETSLDDITDVHSEDQSDSLPLPPPPPPPLPPKNINSISTTYSPLSSAVSSLAAVSKVRPKSSPEQALSQSEIKAIQKRAVYEFYLRQKEKKEKAKLRSPPESPCKNNNSSSLSGSIVTSTAFASLSSESSQAKTYFEHEDDGIIKEEELLPLPTPPPPLSAINGNKSTCNAESTRFFADFAPPSPTETAFPPPPTPVATESPPFPIPPTPLPVLSANQYNGSAEMSRISSPELPLPPSSGIATNFITSVSDSKSNRSCKQMYKNVDLSTLWPSIDFTCLLQSLPMPPLVKESNLDEAEEEDDEELASIEANRQRAQAVDWCMSQLQLEQRRIDEEFEENEMTVGALVRNRLSADDTLAIDGNKLELLVKDMIMIIRLMTSIVQQLTLIETEWNGKKVQLAGTSAFSGVSPTIATTTNHSVIETKKSADSNGTLNSHANDVVNSYGLGVYCSEATTTTVDVDLCNEKRMRLLGQLEEAKRLRDNIETRRTMLEQRLARKCAARNSSDLTTKTTTTATNHSSMLLISDAALPLASLTNGADGYQAVASGGRSKLTTALSRQDIDLTTLIRYYLSRKEHLMVQQEVGKLMHAELHTRIAHTNAVLVARRPSEQANVCPTTQPLN